jgi:hypothetical protein
MRKSIIKTLYLDLEVKFMEIINSNIAIEEVGFTPACPTVCLIICIGTEAMGAGPATALAIVEL